MMYYWGGKHMVENVGAKFKPISVLFDQEPPYRPKIESVLPDVIHFRRQSRRLESVHFPQYVAFFRDNDDDHAEEFPIPIKVPDLDNIKTSYYALIQMLEGSDFRFGEVKPDHAENIFVDRLAEFLSVRPSSDAGDPTIVRSNRKGDTIIYAKGFFTSTGTALGISTASCYLDSGRYSFGIIDSGRHRWQNIVWTCPTTVKVDLP